MAIFEGLSSRLQSAVNKLRGMTRVTEKDVKDIMREVRLSLLEADVNYKVVKSFVSSVSEKALGEEVLKSLTPGQMIVKIVNDELVELLGGTSTALTVSPKLPSIYMLVGLQGSGKTTSAGKLANNLRKNGKKPLLVACDVYRPAAIKQLQVLGKQLDIPVYAEEDVKDPVRIAENAIKRAEYMLYDTVILDTAGRLHIDEELMDELKNIKNKVHPQEILLVVDSMTGQDAVNVSQSFNDLVGIDGVIITKLDGDTRGGAALSVKTVTGKPIKFAGTGEKMNDFEPFHPERMASRILGMGDVLSLIEQAQEAFDEDEAAKLEKKMRENRFTLDDYLEQMRQVRKMGSFKKLMGLIPGMDRLNVSDEDIEKGEESMKKNEAIICSMTMAERNNPSLLNASRKKRVAAGSGTTVQDINILLKGFDQVKSMMKNITGGNGKVKASKAMRSMRNMKDFEL